MKTTTDNGHEAAPKKRARQASRKQDEALLSAVAHGEVAASAAEPQPAVLDPQACKGHRMGVVQSDDVYLEGSFLLAAIAQKELRANGSNMGLAVAGQQMEFMNGGGSTFIAGQDVNLTNSGARFMIAGRDVKVTNGGGGVLFAGRDVHVGEPNAAIQIAGNALESEGKGGLFLAGHQVRVRGGFVGVVFSANTTLEGDARVLLDLSPRGVVKTIMGLVAAPIALLRWLLPGGAPSPESATEMVGGENGAGI